MEGGTLLVVDTETTGLDVNRDRVVEVAAVEADLDGGAAHVVRMDTLVRPGIAIGCDAMGTHHITEAMAAQGRDWNGVKQEFDALCAPPGVVVGAHFAEFDRAMMRCNDGPEWIDTVRIARHAYPDAPNHKGQTLRYLLGIELPEAMAEHAHRAAADAWLVAEMVARAAQVLGIGDLAGLAAKAAEPVLLKVCDFGKHRGTPWSEVPKSYLQWMLGQDFNADQAYTARHWLG